MYRMGKKEVDRVARVLTSGKVFRYRVGHECERFEQRFAEFVGTRYCVQTASGTNALTAALIGVGIGPGDEVLVPACTYMATAVAVLAAGAIPVIVDIDESLTMDAEAVDAAVGRHTRAMIPVHMWGLSCNMKALMSVARKHRLLVVEDVCQAVGGGYEGRMLGSFGHMGAFSFNYFKNISCGEGGAVLTNKKAWFRSAQCAVDCCGFYWDDAKRGSHGFTANSARPSEIEGAILNAQLDRLPAMIRIMRRQKKRILRETAKAGLTPIPANSLDHECGTHAVFAFDTAKRAEAFAKLAGGTVAINTGRHVYTEWDPVLAHHGSHHPALNPYNLKENRACRKEYTRDMCARSLDILSRSVFVTNHPDRKAAEVGVLVKRLKDAARKSAG